MLAPQQGHDEAILHAAAAHLHWPLRQMTKGRASPRLLCTLLVLQLKVKMVQLLRLYGTAPGEDKVLDVMGRWRALFSTLAELSSKVLSTHVRIDAQ